MMFKLRTLKKIFAVSAFALAFSFQSTFAQEAVSMAVSELKKEATALIAQKKYLEARPYVQELIKRFEDSEDENLKATLEQFYYFDAYGYLQEYVNNKGDKNIAKKAIAGFDKVIKNFPKGEFAIESIKMKASCYDELGNFNEAVKARELLLSDTYKKDVTEFERVEIINTIAQMAFYGRKWDIGQKWFKMLFDSAKNTEDKVFAAMALIQSACSKKNYEEAKKYFPYLAYNTPARCDFALNYALLTSGDALVKAGKVAEASLFYSMVMNKDAIVSNFEKFVKNAEDKAKIAESQGKANVKVLQQKAKMLSNQLNVFKGLPDYSAELMVRNARNFIISKRNYESFWSYYQLIRTYADNPSVQAFYYYAILCANGVGKLDIMHDLAEEYIKKYADGEYIKEVKYYNADYYLKKKDYKKFFALAKKFVDEYAEAEDEIALILIHVMGQTWLDREEYDELVNTYKKYVENSDFNDTSIQEACMYWIGMTYMAQGDYENVLKSLTLLCKKYQGTYHEDALYRCGVSAFALGKFSEARKSFEEFKSTYSNSSLIGEVEFFLGDICANLNETKEAIEHYKNVEGNTKSKATINSSYMQHAKLLHNTETVKGYRDEIKLMDDYVKKYPKGVCSQAIYNKAMALEKLGDPAGALITLGKAIETYGANPKDDGVDKIILAYEKMYESNLKKLEATKGAISELLANKDLLEKMITTPAERYRYLKKENPLVDERLYEDFKRNPKFDISMLENPKLLKDRLASYENQLKRYPKGGTEKIFKDMLKKAKSAKNDTLAYRLMMGLDFIGKPTKVDVSFNKSDLKKSSVRTLVWIGKINASAQPDFAREAFKEGLARKEYEYAVDILFEHAALELAQENYDKALDLYTTLVDEYGSDYRAATAMILKGDTLAKMKNLKESIKCYETVLRTPAWRNSEQAYAEALYKLGQVAEEAGQIEKALMYYDRCYLGFSNCYNWTGKAVIAAAKILNEKQNKRDEAKALCNEYLTTEANKASPDYEAVKSLNNRIL